MIVYGIFKIYSSFYSFLFFYPRFSLLNSLAVPDAIPDWFAFVLSVYGRKEV